MGDNRWRSLLSGLTEIVEWHKDGMVIIGGIAVYLHYSEFASQNDLSKSIAERSFDIDFMLSLPEFADLRDMEYVSQNAKLSKYQFRKNKIEYDIYLENFHNLSVSYQSAKEFCVQIADKTVACLEHLLGLKFVAYEDRKGSTKGEKDRRDIVKIVAMMESPRKEALNHIAPFIDLDELAKIAKSAAIMDICEGSEYQAKSLRKLYTQNLGKVISLLHEDKPELTGNAPLVTKRDYGL